jgi:hypothetical protein
VADYNRRVNECCSRRPHRLSGQQPGIWPLRGSPLRNFLLLKDLLKTELIARWDFVSLCPSNGHDALASNLKQERIDSADGNDCDGADEYCDVQVVKTRLARRGGSELNKFSETRAGLSKPSRYRSAMNGARQEPLHAFVFSRTGVLRRRSQCAL